MPKVSAAIIAIVRTQRALRADPSLAAKVGNRRFPPEQAALIASVVERDAPFYNPEISERDIARLNGFAQNVGILGDTVPYERLVALRFRDLWSN